MDKEQIRRLLDQHQKAYKLLLWLGKKAAHNTNIFSPDAITALSDGQLCGSWIEKHQKEIPLELRPGESEVVMFANLLVSFLDTSFRIQVQEFNGKILEARLRRIGNPTSIQKPNPQLRVLMTTAMRGLASDEGISIDQETIRRVVDRIDLRGELWIWLYIHELNRRSLGKARGNVDHKIWKAIPVDARKNLDVDVVWEARSRLLSEMDRATKKGS